MAAPIRFLAPPLLALALAVAAPVAPSRAAVFDPDTFTLENGLKVVVIPYRRAPVVTHMVFYKVGAADEPPGKSGIAHFLEHLMFKGTKDIPPGEFSKIVAAHGGRDNAFTSWDYTGYFQSIARNRLELVMRMEADRMQNLVLDDAVVLPERDVILAERDQRIGNQPASMLGEQMRAALYLNHPYGTPIIGWEPEIRGLDTADALAFYRRHYMPNNAILLVAGDITAEELRPLAEKYYGPIPAGDAPQRVRPPEPEHSAPRLVTLKDPRAGQARWVRDYLAPSYNAGDTAHAYPLQILSEILGGGATSRLYRKLVVEDGIATGVATRYDPVALEWSEFTLYAMPSQGHDIADVAAAIEAEIARLLKEGATEEEVERARNRLQSSAIYARDSLSTGARVLGTAIAAGVGIAEVEAWPDRIAEVTVEQVDAAARALFDERRSVTGHLVPAEPTGPGQ